MRNVQILDRHDDSAPVTGAFKVDPHRGQHNGTVSSQWFSRPADQRLGWRRRSNTTDQAATWRVSRAPRPEPSSSSSR